MIGSLDVPPLALGTMYFGTLVSKDVARGCLDAADEVGARFWDTANAYAFWVGGTGDESETVLGDWFAANGQAARDRIVLATKVGARPLPGHADLQHMTGLSASAVHDQLIASLRRLRTDRVEVLYTHLDDRSVPLNETLGALAELVTEGLVGEVAASNLTAPRLREALAVDTPHPYRALQQRFTYLPADPSADTTPQLVLDAETEREASAAGVALVGYSPLLSGAYTRRDRPVPPEHNDDRTAERMRLLQDRAGEIGLDAGQLVLAWMSQRATPVIPIVGVSRAEQVRSAWTGVTTTLPPGVIGELEDARS